MACPGLHAHLCTQLSGSVCSVSGCFISLIWFHCCEVHGTLPAGPLFMSPWLSSGVCVLGGFQQMICPAVGTNSCCKVCAVSACLLLPGSIHLPLGTQTTLLNHSHLEKQLTSTVDLLCARHCTKGFLCQHIWFRSPMRLLVTILHVRKLRPTDVQ